MRKDFFEADSIVSEIIKEWSTDYSSDDETLNDMRHELMDFLLCGDFHSFIHSVGLIDWSSSSNAIGAAVDRAMVLCGEV